MQPVPVSTRHAACLLAVLLAFAASDAATAARVAAASAAARLLSFPASAAVRMELKSHRDDPIPSSGWTPKFRFAGQPAVVDCTVVLPQWDSLMLREQRRSGTISCTTPWKIDGDNQTFEVYEKGAKVAEGKLVH